MSSNHVFKCSYRVGGVVVRIPNSHAGGRGSIPISANPREVG